MNPVTILGACIAAMLLAFTHLTHAQSLENSPSFHQLSFRTGPNGQTDMGGFGSELDIFFSGLGSDRYAGRAGSWRRRVFQRRNSRRW